MEAAEEGKALLSVKGETNPVVAACVVVLARDGLADPAFYYLVKISPPPPSVRRCHNNTGQRGRDERAKKSLISPDLKRGRRSAHVVQCTSMKQDNKQIARIEWD